MEVTTLINVLAAASVLLLLIWRFSGGHYGELRPSEEVTEAFETSLFDPEKDYYISGPDLYPHAMICLDKSRRLVCGRRET